MVKANFSAYDTYVTDSLYQWDLNQVLRVTGLNLSVVPEVHFSNANMDKAIVRQATMSNFVVSVDIPNSMLQDPLTIHAHIGIYEGSTFKIVEKVEIPVIPKERPSDYQIEDADEEIYSFKALENALAQKADNAVINARVDNIIAHNNDTAGNTELIDMRTDFNGLVHTSAGKAVRTHIKKLTNGRLSLATLLPSSIGNYPSISTVDKTFTIGGDTLIINDRLPMGFISLHENNGNNIVTWGSEITSSAICFYYDIANNKLVALNYNVSVEDLNYILLATLRIGHGTSEGKAWAVCSCPIYVNGKLSTEVNPIGGFVALLPPMHEKSIYPKFSTSDNTFTIPYDTLAVDPRLTDNYVSFREENGNTSVYFGDIVTSAICIYYSIETNTLVAKPYNEKVNTFDYLLVCTIRKTSANGDVIPMAYASCPVWIDDRLSTDKAADPIVYDNNLIKSINHRGYNIEAPENTLSAFKLSKKKGFEYVECDVSFTSDDVPVLLHDSTIDRTSNGTGNISALTFEEVRAFDFGSWFSSDYAGEKIPRFDEFILLCRNLGLHPYIEIKSSATYTQTQIETLVNIVKRAGMSDKVSWISFTATYLEYVKNINPNARLGYVVGGVTEDIIATAQLLKTDHNEVFIDASYGSLTENQVNMCVIANIPLEVWTVNDATGINGLDRYISGVTSDNLIAGREITNANI